MGAGVNFQAIVLVGGLGTRLRETVPDVPKALAPVAGRPFIEYLLVALAAAGCTRAVLAVGYRHDLVVNHLGASFAGLSLDYSVEDVPLGTGGAARKALTKIDTPQSLLLNGDTWLDLDFRAMVAAHRTASARVTIAVLEVADVARYGAVEVEDQRVVRFAEKGRSGAGLINAGAYVLEPDLFDEVAMPEAFSLERDFLSPNLTRLSPLAYAVQGGFIDIGTPSDYQRAQGFFDAVTQSPKETRS